jgi:outer membrane protein OmpA-like peptidoglycan-associated protein/peptidoglycan hydrolase-like protein with peptidoglycan-binding domain
MMIRSMPGFANKPRGEDAVRWYQRTRKLKVDGDAGPETRKKLVTEYMALDGTSLEELGVAVAAVAHGCGSNFPLPGPDAKGGAPAEGEPPAKEQKNPQSGRRVELFFFDTEFGMVPAPPSDTSKAGSQEYEAWQKSVVETHALEAGGDGAKLVFIEFGDTLFRTNSAVVLPDGEAPGAAPGAAERVAAASVVANVIRYNERQRGKKRVVVAGHTDTEGEASVNKPLSEERAKCVLAVVTGDREEFKNLCDARHKVSDYKQVLAWASSSLEGLTFDCHPGAIDDDAATGKPAVERFQRAYNRNKSALGSSEADLGVDGKVGKLTWGAFFDCYEFALRKKLGVDAAGMKDLRKRLTFADDDHKAIGFGEYFPVEEQGVDDRESQVNRRAEVIFLDPEEIPDLEHAAEDPETSELYLPGGFVHVPVAGALRSTEFNVRLRTPDDEPIAGELYALSAGGEVLDTNVTGLDGGIRFSLEPGTTEVQVELPNLERTLTFAVGGLASMSEGDGIAGAQGRLMNLGFGVPSVTGSIDPDTEAALRDFQREGKLTESGQLDGPTKAELVRRYGS